MTDSVIDQHTFPADSAVLCREESQEIWAHRDEFEKLGVRLVLVVREWIQREIDAFAPAYWGGEYYFDPESVLYATTQGGEIKKASKLSLLNPFSTYAGGGWEKM